jgi:signal transduction histidine kinase
MKIRTQFILTMSLFGLLLIVMAASLIVTNRQVDRLNQQEEIAHNIERGASELSYLSNEYLLYRESQQRARWESKFSSLSEDLSKLNATRPEQQVLVDRIEANQERLKAVFADVVATLENTSQTPDTAADMAFIQVSWSRMEVQNQGIVFDALLLSQKVSGQVDQLKQTNAVLIFVLVGLFGAYLLTNYWMIYRRTLRSLSDLQAGTEIIGSGNLDYAIADERADEIGELSRAFDRMTRNLRDVTASKADLEREIAERKQAQASLARQAEELARSNKELEQFAYVASHDLQEPLRMVASYVQLLADRYQGRLDENADRYIEYAVDGARRMKLLINDLLAYSRVGTHGRPPVPTDSQAVLEEVLSGLQVAVEEQQASVTHDPLPTVLADEVQLGQVFQNLIGNALKFCGEAAPRIHVGVKRDAERGAWRFSVADNGIGLDPKYAERIFMLFQRLHGPTEYPGTGIGLAICKKILERHGGRIWVESQPGQGATFYFTVPGAGKR